jgi:hypothetical protein
MKFNTSEYTVTLLVGLSNYSNVPRVAVSFNVTLMAPVANGTEESSTKMLAAQMFAPYW